MTPYSTSLGGLILLLFSLLNLIHNVTADTYHESLHLHPLPSQFLLASFNFRSHGPISAFDKQMFQLFPRSLGQILQHTHVRELHLRFALGRWDSELWGAQPGDGQNAGGTGVEVWAWVEGANDVEAEARWTSLNNALSGLFCASLNFISSTRTIRPIMSFTPTGSLQNLHSDNNNNTIFLLHGSLPKEPVCTENLTPFLKLLPCKGKSGISTLLDGHKLFDASFQSMSIDVRPICKDSGDCDIEISQNIDMVLDISRSLQRRDSPVPRPRDQHELVCDTTKDYAGNEYCYPLDNSFDMPWSLSDLFGRGISGSCPFTEGKEGDVCISGDEERLKMVQNTEGGVLISGNQGERCYKLQENQPFNVVFPKQSPPTKPVRQEPLLYAERSFTGHGQEHGGVKTVLRNPSFEDDIEVVYLESLPWFMKPYLHTLTTRVLPEIEGEKKKDVVEEVYYRPAVDRLRGTQLEMKLVVPKGGVVILTYGFEKAVLRYTEYPPDANRGFDVASAIITIPAHIRKSDGKKIPSTAIRTTSLLLSLPTPDFSMPYNVIIFTSTIMALAFGSIFNLLVRRFVAVDEVGRVDLKGKVRGWIGKLVKGKRE